MGGGPLLFAAWVQGDSRGLWVVLSALRGLRCRLPPASSPRFVYGLTVGVRLDGTGVVSLEAPRAGYDVLNVSPPLQVEADRLVGAQSGFQGRMHRLLAAQTLAGFVYPFDFDQPDLVAQDLVRRTRQALNRPQRGGAWEATPQPTQDSTPVDGLADPWR